MDGATGPTVDETVNPVGAAILSNLLRLSMLSMLKKIAGCDVTCVVDCFCCGLFTTVGVLIFLPGNKYIDNNKNNCNTNYFIYIM